MSETTGDAVRGGAPCAKEILCFGPARARVRIEALKAQHAAQYKEILKEAMLYGFQEVGREARTGALSAEQMQCYHRCAAVLDKWPKFERAYDALRASLIDEGVKAEIVASGEKY
jgi:hypothetical protein